MRRQSVNVFRTQRIKKRLLRQALFILIVGKTICVGSKGLNKNNCNCLALHNDLQSRIFSKHI